MNYISFTDQLGITLDEVANIDANGIIRLEKQLKAKAMLGDITNLDQINNFIKRLKSEDLRKCYVFIEQHLWLKDLISGKYFTFKANTVFINTSENDDIEVIKSFLEPYLESHLKNFISEHLSRGNYMLLLKVLECNDLFTETINQLVINFFKAKLNFTIAYLKNDKKVKNSQLEVAFITQKNFYRCLNFYPDAFDEEINELNSEIIRIYNTYRRNISNLQFKFTSKAMIAIANIDTSNIFLKDNLEANAKIASSQIYGSSRSRNQRQKSSSGSGVWSIVVVVFLVFRLIFWISKNDYNSSSNYNYQLDNYRTINNTQFQNFDSIVKEALRKKDSINNSEVYETVVESAESNFDPETLSTADKRKLISHVRFLYSIKYKYYKKPRTNTTVSSLQLSANPYPKTFNVIPSKAGNKKTVIISNESEKDLIVFRLKTGVDQSVYIPVNKKASVVLKEKDCLAFYTGTNFLKTKFSHFRDHGRLSELYKIETLERGNKVITVHPPLETNINTTSSKRVKYDAYETDNLKLNAINLNPLGIDELYKDYYNNYYKKN